LKIVQCGFILFLICVMGGKVLAVTPIFTATTTISKTATDRSTVKSSAQSDLTDPTSVNNVMENLAADFSTKGKMKDHFRKGMKFFMKDQYDAAIPDLIASTMIVDPYTWNYWYAEAYATLGVIYEFHSKEQNCQTMAYQYYLLALKRDPKTKSANYYIDRVRPKNKLTSKSAVEKNKNSISSAATSSTLSGNVL
jgi:hypothetical protein